MNRMERGGEALLRYLDGDFQVIRPGAYVTCAQSGAEIPLQQLRYWSVARQEAYAGPAAAMARYKETGEI